MGKSHPFFLKKFQDWTADISALANPILLILVPFIFLGPSPIFFQLIWVLFINEIVCSLIKIIYPKKRPIAQNYASLIEKIDAGSFPSIHSSRITLTYLTLFINTENTALKITMIAVILLVMLSRVILKKHFWIDVLGGFSIGLLLWVIFIK
jgi:membrane-associated phospholipid phosphatase